MVEMVEAVQLLSWLVLGSLFLYAGVEKIRQPAGFAASLANYTSVPPAIRRSARVALPSLEIVLGRALLAARLAWWDLVHGWHSRGRGGRGRSN